MFLFKQSLGWGVEGTKFCFFTLKLLFDSELYITFQVIYMINIVFLLQFCWQPIKGFKTSTNWREHTIFSCQWLENFLFFLKKICLWKISLSMCTRDLFEINIFVSFFSKVIFESGSFGYGFTLKAIKYQTSTFQIYQQRFW